MKAIEQNGDVIGKRLLKQNPGVVPSGLFEKFVKVTESGVPLDYEQFYNYEQFNAWYHITVVKMGDGFVSSTEDITEKKNAQEEILRLKDEIAQRATDRYYSLFNSIDEGFCTIQMIYDEEGMAVDYRFTEVNQSFERQTGLKNVVGKTGKEITPGSERYWVDFYDKVAQTGEAMRFENYHEATNRWYESYASRVGDAKSRHVAIVFNDVTQRKKAEVALRESEERKAFLLDLSDALRPLSDPLKIQQAATQLLRGYLQADRILYTEVRDNGETIHIADSFTRTGSHKILGTFKANDFSGRMVEDLRGGKVTFAEHIALTDEITEAGKATFARLNIAAFAIAPLVKEGHWVSNLGLYHSTPRTWRPPEIAMLQETAERTWAAVERARAEEALRKSEAKFRRLSESGIVGIAFFELKGAVLDANDAFLHTLGVSREDVDSRKLRWHTYVPSEWMDGTHEAVEKLKRTGYAAPYEKQYYHTSGELRWGLFAGALFEDGETGVAMVIDITDRKRVEEELAKSRELLSKELEDTRGLQKISSRIIEEGDVQALYEAIVDSAMEIMHANFGSIQILVPENEELFLFAWKGFHPASAEHWRHIYANSATTGGKALQQGARIVVPDIDNWAEVSKEDLDEYHRSGIVAMQSTPLVSRSGKVVGMLSTHWKQVHQPSERELVLLEVLARQAADLVERKQVEDALRNSEHGLRTLANAVPQVIWTNNAEGRANYFNQRWYEYSGLTYEQSVGPGWQLVVHPDDAPASVKKWKAALASGEIFDTEYRLRRHDGNYSWFIGRNVPLKDDTGRVTGWFGSATNIDDLKQAVEALAQSEARLRITMESATDYAIITMDTERRVEKWSSGASLTFGYSEAEITGQSADIIFTEEDRAAGAPQQEMEAARDTGRAADERWHVRKDGSRFYVSGVMRPIKSKELTGYVKVLRDMTQQQLFTEELHRLVAERTFELQRSNEDLRQFAHVASHDLKEPVRKIKTFNNRIMEDFSNDLPPKVKKYLNKISSSTDRMYAMIEGVLDYSKMGNTEQPVEPVDLNKVIREIEVDLEVLIQQKNATIVKVNLPNLPGVRFLLYQLFYNLILNSLKFAKTDEPALIEIGCETENQDGKRFYKIMLSDNGIGFEQEYAESIFATFTRLNPADEYEGTGLGLALCKKIVERHKGFISATGELNKGASFTITLPA